MLRDEWTTYSNWCALHFLEHQRVLPCSPPAPSPTPGTPPATAAPCLARTAGVGRARGRGASPSPPELPLKDGDVPNLCLRALQSTISCEHRHLSRAQHCPRTVHRFPSTPGICCPPLPPGRSRRRRHWQPGGKEKAPCLGREVSELRSAAALPVRRGKGRQPPPCRGAAGPQAVGAIVMQ